MNKNVLEQVSLGFQLVAASDEPKTVDAAEAFNDDKVQDIAEPFKQSKEVHSKVIPLKSDVMVGKLGPKIAQLQI